MRLRESRGLSALLAVLPDSKYEVQTHARSGDPVVVFPHGIQATRLLPVWVGEGFPRDAERALRRLDHAGAAADETLVPVLVAHRFSNGTRDLLDHQQLSWADETGRVRIRSREGLFIDRDRALDVEERRRMLPTLRWSSSAGAVAEDLLLRRTIERNELADDAGNWNTPRPADLAEAIGWSPQQVSRVLQTFDKEGWTKKSGAERGANALRALVDPNGMLSAWAGWHRTRRLTHVAAHTSQRDVVQLLHDRILPALPGDQVAFTGWVALDAVAPLMTDTPSVSVYLSGDSFDSHMHDILDRAGLRSVRSAARVNFYRAEPHVLRHSKIFHGLPVVSPIRLYGDLLRQGLRGEDAADHVRETIIGF